MCLILLAYRIHTTFDLILAANRDEFYSRPSLPPDFWEEESRLLAGRDLVAGGTWLGITRTGRLAAITNYRDPSSFLKNAPSRGKVVSDFLKGSESPWEYLDHIRAEAGTYNGFNLLIGDLDSIFWFSNRNGTVRRLSPGLYGISNHLLDTPWPKVLRGKELMAPLLREENPSREELFRIMRDTVLPADEMLPSTGVDLDWERTLSPIFIQSPDYGTRSSTLIFISRKRRVTFIDRTYDSDPDHAQENRFEFSLESRDAGKSNRE